MSNPNFVHLHVHPHYLSIFVDTDVVNASSVPSQGICYDIKMKLLEIPNKKKLSNVMIRNQIEFAALFGSRAKGTAKQGSDYDILIEFSPSARVGLFKYQSIENDISSVLGGRVDLVTVGGIDKYIKDEVYGTMKVIYDNRSKRQS